MRLKDLPQHDTPAPAKAGAGRTLWLLGCAVATFGGALTAATPRVASYVYPDGPPPGFTGGFNEQTCVNCHFDKELNTPGGTISIGGVPARYTAGQSYPLTIVLTRSGMKVGGFELSARFEQGGMQAGTLAVPSDAQSRETVVTDRNVQYAFQRRPGTQLQSPDTARWTVVWTAPGSGGAVQFNVAGNAADGDDSTFGDFIHTAVAKSEAPGG